MVLELGAWAWVNGASTAAALRASPAGSDVATTLHANLVGGLWAESSYSDSSFSMAGPERGSMAHQWLQR